MKNKRAVTFNQDIYKNGKGIDESEVASDEGGEGFVNKNIEK